MRRDFGFLPGWLLLFGGGEEKEDTRTLQDVMDDEYPTSEFKPDQTFDEWAADGEQVEYDTRTDPALEPDPFSPREWNQQVKYIEEGGPAEAWAVELYNLEGSSHYDLFESALASASADQYRRDRNSMGRQTALLNQIELVQRLAVRERAANRWDQVWLETGSLPTIERGADPLGSDEGGVSSRPTLHSIPRRQMVCVLLKLVQELQIQL